MATASKGVSASNGSYPRSPFQDQLALLPITCRISEAAYEKLRELQWRCSLSMGVDGKKPFDGWNGVRLLHVNKSFFTRWTPDFKRGWDEEEIAPALCRGFDAACKRGLFRTPGKWYDLGGERDIVCEHDTKVDLPEIRTILRICSEERFPFEQLPARDSANEYLELVIDYKIGWKLTSQYYRENFSRILDNLKLRLE